MTWSTNAPGLPDPLLPAGQVIHFGADMFGSGRIIDAYWTKDGQRVLTIPIVYELTRVWVPGDPTDPLPPPDPGTIEMLLSPAELYTAGDIYLKNIRTWYDIPAVQLGLADINRELDEGTIGGENGQSQAGLFQIDSFFDVFYVGRTDPGHLGPQFESLLIADIYTVTGAPGQQVETRVGTFWNLNPQSPEPGTLALLAIGGLAALRRRRRR